MHVVKCLTSNIQVWLNTICASDVFLVILSASVFFCFFAEYITVWREQWKDQTFTDSIANFNRFDAICVNYAIYNKPKRMLSIHFFQNEAGTIRKILLERQSLRELSFLFFYYERSELVFRNEGKKTEKSNSLEVFSNHFVPLITYSE